MKKLLLGLLSLPILSFGQYSLDFSNPGWGTGSSYNSNHVYTDNTSDPLHPVTYEVKNLRISAETENEPNFTITGATAIYRNQDNGYVTWTSLNGLENLSFKYRKAFTSSDIRNLKVTVTKTVDNVVVETLFENISNITNTTPLLFNHDFNLTGNITVRIENSSPSGNGKQIAIDDIEWSSFESSTPAPCLIENVDISALTCNNNDTELVTTDDKVQFTLNVSATSGGANGYIVTTSDYAVLGTNTGVFGTPTTFTLEEGSVAGDDFTITVTSVDSTTCSFTSATIVNATVECSTPPSACDLTSAAVTAISCDTGADINDISDDAINFTLNVQGVVTSTNGYTITANAGTLSVAEGAYNTPLAISITGAGAGNVELTIVDADDLNCTITTTVTNPGLCSGPSAVTAASASLTFTHMAGTPSASQNVAITGAYLTSDITATASTGFEVSADNTTFASTATLVATNNTVSAPIYVRANAATIGTSTGTVTLTATNATDVIINLTNTATGYTVYTIDQINGIDPTGVADSLNVLVELSGVVQCMDYRADGYSMVIIDGSNKGINVYRGGNLTNYTEPVGGDSITVKGKIVQFRGLLQVEATEITFHGSNYEQVTPIATTVLDETTENYPVVLQNITLVPNQTDLADGLWPASGSYNPTFTDGTNEFKVRAIGTPLAGTALPNGPVSITGIASQFASSTSAPFLDGYQLLICNENAIAIVCEGANLPNATINVFNDTTLVTTNIQGATYIWTNCDTEEVVTGATAYNFTPTVAGNYKVTIINGECEATSTCSAITVSINNVELGNAIKMYPNPVVDQLTINNFSDVAVTFTVTDMNGKVVTENTTLNSVQTINTTSWNKGVYFVNFIGANNATHTMKVVK